MSGSFSLALPGAFPRGYAGWRPDAQWKYFPAMEEETAGAGSGTPWAEAARPFLMAWRHEG